MQLMRFLLNFSWCLILMLINYVLNFYFTITFVKRYRKKHTKHNLKDSAHKRVLIFSILQNNKLFNFCFIHIHYVESVDLIPQTCVLFPHFFCISPFDLDFSPPNKKSRANNCLSARLLKRSPVNAQNFIEQPNPAPGQRLEYPASFAAS